MSNLGGDDAVLAEPEVSAVLLRPPPPTREERIEQSVAATRVTWGPSFEEDRARTRATRAVDRSYYPEGTVRQFRAIAGAGSRREGLGRVRIPVLVIHGDADPLVPFANAERTVLAAPGAELLVMKGVGHEMPPWEWANIADGIALLAGSLSNSG
jgi:pimeloyl-ACP methyl ester carboxylesterase